MGPDQLTHTEAAFESESCLLNDSKSAMGNFLKSKSVIEMEFGFTSTLQRFSGKVEKQKEGSDGRLTRLIRFTTGEGSGKYMYPNSCYIWVHYMNGASGKKAW